MPFAARSHCSGGHLADDDADDVSRHNCYSDASASGCSGLGDAEDEIAGFVVEGAVEQPAKEATAVAELAGHSRVGGGGSALLHSADAENCVEVWRRATRDV
jgi:hypothetical protein